MSIDLHKLSRKHSTHVEVLRVRLERLIVTQDLSRAGCGHGSDQQGVPQAVLGDLGPQGIPVPAATLRLSAPQVELQLAFACWATLVRLVCALDSCQLTGGLACCVVDCLEDVFIEALCWLTLKRKPHHEERICKALNTKTHRSILHVGASRLLHRIVVAVDDLVEVLRGYFRHLVELLKVVFLALGRRSKSWQSNGGKVANCHLIGICVLNDFCAKVGAVDGTQVLLI
mmetsp:Transcript_10715/g.19052  ORF Transcript_10715/g.19052 Transcript_10715/m.19052 type:complete len:229 (+) Transcript_10715:211-897(+)